MYLKQKLLKLDKKIKTLQKMYDITLDKYRKKCLHENIDSLISNLGYFCSICGKFLKRK